MNIIMQLNKKSIEGAIKELKKYKLYVEQKTKLLEERLALIGAQEASIRFTTAMYDGNNDVTVDVFPTGKGWTIVASGEAVCFIEFGAGVYHNTSEPYPNPRPTGVVGIGEYGKGRGKRKAWGFYDESGELVVTRGTPAALGMWYATAEMERMIETIAREVFR